MHVRCSAAPRAHSPAIAVPVVAAAAVAPVAHSRPSSGGGGVRVNLVQTGWCELNLGGSTGQRETGRHNAKDGYGYVYRHTHPRRVTHGHRAIILGQKKYDFLFSTILAWYVLMCLLRGPNGHI
jgi:hypothetical protein